MRFEIQKKIKDTKNMYQYLKENSYWIKELNRSGTNYKTFEEAMKDIYHLRVTDKVGDAIDNIDLITSFLDAFKS